MFTLKFYSTNNYHVISAPHYNIYNQGEYYEVTLYKDFTSTDGVSYRVSKTDIGVPHYIEMFVENSHGKTIEHI